MPAAVWPITCRRLTNRAVLRGQPMADLEGGNVHRLSLIVVILALVLSGPAGIAAQDATPGTTSAAEAIPALHVRATDDALEVPEAVPAGRYLLTLENASSGLAGAYPLRQPEGLDAAAMQEGIQEAIASPEGRVPQLVLRGGRGRRSLHRAGPAGTGNR
jgi:hypothetical protein